MNMPWANMIEDYANSLAGNGFVGLIPDYLAVTNTQPGLGVLPMMMELQDDWEEAISDAIDQAKNLPMVDPARIGLLGFSLGGHLCLRARGKAKVLVEFFAPVFQGIGARAGAVQAQIHHGDADDVVRFHDAEMIAAILKAEGTVADFHRYVGGVHGFIGDDAANTKARAFAKEKTLGFFKSHL